MIEDSLAWTQCPAKIRKGATGHAQALRQLRTLAQPAFPGVSCRERPAAARPNKPRHDWVPPLSLCFQGPQSHGRGSAHTHVRSLPPSSGLEACPGRPELANGPDFAITQVLEISNTELFSQLHSLLRPTRQPPGNRRHSYSSFPDEKTNDKRLGARSATGPGRS